MGRRKFERSIETRLHSVWPILAAERRRRRNLPSSSSFMISAKGNLERDKGRFMNRHFAKTVEMFHTVKLFVCVCIQICSVRETFAVEEKSVL